MDAFSQQAFELVKSPKVQGRFDLTKGRRKSATSRRPTQGSDWRPPGARLVERESASCRWTWAAGTRTPTISKS